jgi:hypothetical protein
VRRPPDQSDITLLAAALAEHSVQYAMLGGAAMALHGFPRMTKDIDLLLPVDPVNNDLLIRALHALPGAADAIGMLRREWMDKGHSTELLADISVDLLYVAADCTFEDLRKHVIETEVGGVKIRTLDVDGMLLSKRTTRPSDVPDRLRLERLREALRTQGVRSSADAPAAPPAQPPAEAD